MGLLHRGARNGRHHSDRAGNSRDNAVLESFFVTLPKEPLVDGVFETPAEASSAVSEFIEVSYNRQRRHSTLGNRTPVEFENQVLMVG